MRSPAINRDSPAWTYPSLVPIHDETGNATTPPVTWRDNVTFDTDGLDSEIGNFDDSPSVEDIAKFSTEINTCTTADEQ